MDMTMILAATFLLALEGVSNKKLAAMNNAIQSFGKLDTSNIAFETAVELQLVKPSGEPFELDALQLACAREVNRRVDAGTFLTEEPHETK